MNRIIVTCVASAALLGIGLLPLAANADAGVNARLHRQHERIQQGVGSGELTRGEHFRLARRDARIHGREYFDRRHDHGHLTAGERFRLERSLNGSSREIYRFKHNDHRQ